MNTPDASEPVAPSDSGKPRRRWLWIMLSLTVLGGVLLFVSMAEDTIDVQETAAPPPAQLVSVETVTTSLETIEVSSFAEVRPRWSVELRAAVSGRVSKVFPSALAGEPVEVDTTLITIENSRYVADLAAAELALKEAQLALWQAKNATLLARGEFERANSTPPNDLALKLPQLEIARNSVVSAQARVRAAKRQLDDTTVVAPFSAFVTERFVSPGQTVSTGDRLLKLADNNTLDLEVELGRKEWSLLRQPLAGLTAHVLDQHGGMIAQAKIRRGGGFLDETTRQYKIFLEIERPASKQLLSGDFVKVLLPGVTVPAALDIPASALTQDGYVWHLDADDRLRRIEPTVLFRRHDRVIVRATTGTDRWRVAITPLVSFLPGQKARAQNAEN